MDNQTWVVVCVNSHFYTGRLKLKSTPVVRYDSLAAARRERDRLRDKYAVTHDDREFYSIMVGRSESIQQVVNDWFARVFSKNEKRARDYMNYRGEDSAPIQSTVKQQETNMSISVTKPTFVNGVAADSFGIDQLIDLIGASQKRVTELQGLGFESKTVAALIAKEEKGIASAIAVLDARKVD